MAGRLEGEIVIISGAARGLGAAQARLFVTEGASVVIGDVLDDAGRATAEVIGDHAEFAHLDVTDAGQWAETVLRCTERFGWPTILVNNAGIIGERAEIAELDETSFRRVIDVNLVGTYLGTRSVIPAMISAGRGSIVNVSSTAGFIGAAGRAAYVASKFGVRGFTKTAALESRPHNIRVNSVHPGSMDTPLFARPEETSFDRQAIPRIGQADEVARLVLFVASSEASFSTGCEFVADGGFLAGLSEFSTTGSRPSTTDNVTPPG